MALYIDSAFLDDIIQVAQMVPVAGAHDLTVTPQVLQELIVDPQSEQAVETFTRD
jgi:hypothetical protein